MKQLEISFTINPFMVRGLDYYNHTVFEIMSEAPVFDTILTTICAVDRYDGLITEFGGPEEFDNGLGFAIGIEWAIIAIEAERGNQRKPEKPDVYLADLTVEAN